MEWLKGKTANKTFIPLEGGNEQLVPQPVQENFTDAVDYNTIPFDRGEAEP